MWHSTSTRQLATMAKLLTGPLQDQQFLLLLDSLLLLLWLHVLYRFGQIVCFSGDSSCPFARFAGDFCTLLLSALGYPRGHPRHPRQPKQPHQTEDGCIPNALTFSQDGLLNPETTATVDALRVQEPYT